MKQFHNEKVFYITSRPEYTDEYDLKKPLNIPSKKGGKKQKNRYHFRNK